MEGGRKLKILATGSYCEVAHGESLPDLKQAVRESTGVAVRRVTRFVQLALVGAGRCCAGQEMTPDTAVYFSSCRGDTEVTTELLDEMVRRREPPGPLTFVNSVSNAACFHVAAVFGLGDRSNFITNRFDPITAALKSAWIDLLRDEVTVALVGSVDACSLPLAAHRQRTRLPAEAPIAEASHWLLLAGESDHRPARAWLRAVKNFSAWEGLREWLEDGDFADTQLAVGQHLGQDDVERIQQVTGIRSVSHYREGLAHYDSQTGAAIEAFVAGHAASMLHVNSDPAGRFSVLWLTGD